MKTALCATISIVAIAAIAYGLPTGAPDTACDAVSPSSPHAPPQTTPSPYNVSGLPLEYTPGIEYQRKLWRGARPFDVTIPCL